MTAETISIVVGVTGHRRIRAEDREPLYRAVTETLTALKARCPSSRIVMLNSLAEGADLLCADAAEALSIPLIAALPMEQTEYETDFSGEALTRFRAHCGAAEQCFAVPWTEPAPAEPDRDFLYRQAGVYVAAHAHVLLALWDGKDGTPDGCGTAEAVGFALDAAYRPAAGIPLQASGSVIHIRTPRDGDRPEEKVGEVRFLGDRAAFDGILARTDEFNALSQKTEAPNPGLLPTERERDRCLDRTEALYAQADALSMRFAARYRCILAALAVVSTVITVAFLLYDEAELHWMILVCGLMLLTAWLLQRRGNKLACHRRYLEYRTLAEALRVQTYLRYAGGSTEAAAVLPWSEQVDTAWIACALRACAIAPAAAAAHDIRDCWVGSQLRYHSKALQKTGRTRRISDRIVRAAFWISIALYLAVLAFECIWGDLLPVSLSAAHADRFRTVCKLLLGSVSAATLFISNYYGKRSLSRAQADHDKMARFYRVAADRIERFGQTDELLLLLAREELIENGNWCSYQRDNAADFSL